MVKKKIITPPAAVKKVASSNTSSIASNPPNYKKGIKRPYFSTVISTKDIEAIKFTKNDYIYATGLTLLALYVRTIGINKPKVIVFDEIHILKHINDYLRGQFFLDITPPFGKLLYTFFAKVLAYSGDATQLTKPGQSFQGTNVPYVGLRFLSALLGSGTVSLTYFILRISGARLVIAVLGALLVTLENSFITSSRLFMFDSLSLFILALAIYAFKKFQFTVPFSKDWARYLVLTGIALGLGISTKWIGFATVGWVGVLTLQQLWYLFGDLDVSNKTLTKHVASRLSSFIVGPTVIYLGVFAVHILLLNNSSSDSALLSTYFQRTLSGNEVYDLPKYVTYGSTVTIRHEASLGGFLHSHPYPYKSGSRNQQVSVFDYRDYNNEWLIEPVGHVDPRDSRVRGDSVIRLRHKNTGAVLRVDDFKPPISEQEYDFEVSCFGNHTYPGNETDSFLLKVEDEGFSRDYVKSLDTKFRLFNKKKRCTVLSHDLRLPEWGFGQQEVICIESPTASRVVFYIETIKYPEDVDFEKNQSLKERIPELIPSFWSKFVELNTKMVKIFRNIKTDSSQNKLSSDPSSWPFLEKGVKYFSGGGINLYLIGNPIIWWLSVMLIPSFLFVRVVDFFRPDNDESSIKFKTNTLQFLVGWILHLVPYIFNKGEFFTSYYNLSLYFGILIIGSTFEYIYFKNVRLGYVLTAITLIFTFYFYSTFTPITYGSSWDVESCEASKLLDTWDYNCDVYKK